MNNSPINSTINSTTVVELADASSLSISIPNMPLTEKINLTPLDKIYSISVVKSILSFLHCFNCFFRIEVLRTICDISEIDNNAIKTFRQIAFLVYLVHLVFRKTINARQTLIR